MGNRIQRISFTFLSIFLFLGCSTNPKNEVNDIEVDSTRSPTAFHPQANPKMIWPIKSKKMSRGFNQNNRKSHDGLDLPAPQGTPIRAVKDGRVIYSGRAFHGYGKMVLIEHSNKIATLYAHCSKIFVRSGDNVLQGHKIALVGKTGRASAPHLHFEVRKSKIPVDPLEFYN